MSVESQSGYVAGFACLVGRPNAGSPASRTRSWGRRSPSPLLEAADDPAHHRGIVTTPASQLVLVDTGSAQAAHLLGERLNDVVRETLLEVDVIGFCLPADQRIGPDDTFIANELKEIQR